MEKSLNIIFEEAARMSTLRAQEGVIDTKSRLDELLTVLDVDQKVVLMEWTYENMTQENEDTMNLIRSALLLHNDARELLASMVLWGRFHPCMFFLNAGLANEQEDAPKDEKYDKDKVAKPDLNYLLNLADGSYQGGRTALAYYVTEKGITEGRYAEGNDFALSWGITKLLKLNEQAHNLCKTGRDEETHPYTFLPFFMRNGPRNAVIACLHTGDYMTMYNPENPLANTDEALRGFFRLLKETPSSELHPSVAELLIEMKPLIQISDARDTIGLALSDHSNASAKVKIERAERIASKARQNFGKDYERLLQDLKI